MRILGRILVSIVGGVLFYASLLFVVFRFWLGLTISKILLWNVVLFGFLGRGEPIGHTPDGSPIYDGAGTYLGFSPESIFTGFVIYPVVFFLCLTLLSRIRLKQFV